MAFANRSLLVILLASLGACSFLPASGPTRNGVESANNGGIYVVDVDEAVAHDLKVGRARRLFSEELTGDQGGSDVVSPGDILEVSVWEAPPALLFSTSVVNSGLAISSNLATMPLQMVGRDGAIYVPFAGKIAVAGKTLAEIEDDITRQLKSKANQPQVLVSLANNNTSYVTVVGEVTNSMRMPLTPRGERLLDALAAAGGTKQPVEKMTVQLTRGAEVYSLPLDTIIRDPRQNIALHPGDVVTALFQPLSFTALGATGKTDEINFEAQGITLAQALARAGGLLDSRSNAAGVFIFRFESPDALKWSHPPATTTDGKVPVVYRVDLTDPRTFFVAQSFLIENKDVLYIANAPAAQLQKFLNLVVSTIYPIQGVINLSQ